MTSINHHTVIHSVNAHRGKSGSYRLKLENESGTDEGRCEVAHSATDDAENSLYDW